MEIEKEQNDQEPNINEGIKKINEIANKITDPN